MARQPEAHGLQLMPKGPLTWELINHAHECHAQCDRTALWPCIAADNLMASVKIEHGNTKHTKELVHARHIPGHSCTGILAEQSGTTERAALVSRPGK